MKNIATAFAITTMTAVLPLAAQVTQTTEKNTVRENADGSVTEKNTTTTRTFNPEVRTRVVKYFDPYKSELYGLPPKLVEVLPPVESTEVRYYVAGSNVVAVDENYRVVDSIQIPSVKITVDD